MIQKFAMPKQLVSTFMVMLCSFLAYAQSPGGNMLWYAKPATQFEEALPLGNGRLGAMVYGGLKTERLSLNESSLWSGGPVDPDMNRDAKNYLKPVRDALFQEDYKKADSLVRFMQGKFSQSYEPLGNLFIDFNHGEEATNYRRQLDIRNAIATTTYEIDQTTYTREVFVSHPAQLIIVRLSARGKNKLSFTCRLNSPLPFIVGKDNDMLHMKGHAPIHAEPNYRGNMPNAIRYDNENAMRFSSLVSVYQTDGMQSLRDTSLNVFNATEAVVIVSLATSFNGYDKNPGKQGLNESALARNYLQKLSQTDLNTLREEHVKDFTGFFDRVSLSLGTDSLNGLTTVERLNRFATGVPDNGLIALYYQFGRYLLISSSRPGGVPPNLQGLWNEQVRPPWSSNYTTNINAQMNYWGVETANLSELHQPFLDFMKRLETTGKITARNFYNAGGWTCHHNTDIWGMTNPVGDFGQGSPCWANWPMGGAWLATHLWEHFAFTRDTNYLRNHAYPLMKGAVQFCLDFLTKDKKGYLVTAPSTSPENVYITDKGYHGQTLYGGTADHAMIRELFSDFIKAAEVLRLDQQLRKKVSETAKNIYPYQVGKKGNLQEWYHDWEDEDPHHRHLSHLFGAYPGASITTSATPALADAVRKSLEIRTNEGTGWAITWRINLWARLQNGERAYDAIKKMMRFVGNDATVRMGGGGVYANLYGAHPPFQIDGNFGGSAGISEMLLQSHQDYIELLPALPAEWPEGKVKGLVARGGFVIDMEWKNGILTSASVYAKTKGRCKVKYGKNVSLLAIPKGKKVDVLF
jgi:alpha-L-fucosidase 2